MIEFDKYNVELFQRIVKILNREYIYHESTISICPQCNTTLPAKIVRKNGSVYILKNCKVHGEQLEILEEDEGYHLIKRNYDKSGTPCATQTIVDKGCPFDCGLCPSHDQHSCIALIEVTNNCNLECKVCYAGAKNGDFLSLEKIESMMDFWIESENGNAEVLQISGGEPSTHPQIIDIIKIAKSKKIKYVMLNTNGIRIAEDEEFVKELSNFIGGFEVYLQFDGFDKTSYEHYRGRDLTDIKKTAIANLTKYKVPTTLVVTLENGINDGEIGEIVEFAINTKYIRGINFQPVGYFGRTNGTDTKNRITMSGVLNRIEAQTSGMIKKSDFIPLPCNVERVSITYLFKTKNGFIPITRNEKMKNYIPFVNNTFVFKVEDMLVENKESLFKFPVCDCLNFLKDFKQFIPINFAAKSKDERIEFVDENTFRISISSFIDKYNFDIKSMQKECVHVITPDYKKIPFSAYNMFHREGYNNDIG